MESSAQRILLGLRSGFFYSLPRSPKKYYLSREGLPTYLTYSKYQKTVKKRRKMAIYREQWADY